MNAYYSDALCRVETVEDLAPGVAIDEGGNIELHPIGNQEMTSVVLDCEDIVALVQLAAAYMDETQTNRIAEALGIAD